MKLGRVGRLLVVVKLAIGAVMATAIACGSGDDVETSGSSTSGGTSGSSSGTSGTSGYLPSSDAGTGADFAAATGVVIVHTASFPSFRLCFENMLDRVPQPDRTVMPEANVVGVEVGSLVRIDPMDAPGAIYVIKQSSVPALPGTREKTCAELIGKPDGGGGGSLEVINDFYATAPINEALGRNRVDALVISGCGSQPMLDILDGYGIGSGGKGNNKGCGEGWDATYGKLTATRAELPFNRNARVTSTVPVQVVNLAPSLTALKGDASVTFGELANDASAAAFDVPVAAPFTPGEPKNINIEQDAASTFGTHGFVVSATSTDGTVRSTQSLANVQQLSSPSELPTSYYQAASNYALLLLGDPSHKTTAPTYNPRRALHLLAVPVQDPAKVDAGTGPLPPPGPPLDAATD